LKFIDLAIFTQLKDKGDTICIKIKTKTG